MADTGDLKAPPGQPGCGFESRRGQSDDSRTGLSRGPRAAPFEVWLMLTLARRLLVLAALMFWQGGFTFYSAVVIQVGAEVFHSHLDQGFVTQRVSNYLNLAGAAALPLLAWDVLASRDVRWRRRLRWAVWAVLAGTLALLAWMHVR